MEAFWLSDEEKERDARERERDREREKDRERERREREGNGDCMTQVLAWGFAIIGVIVTIITLAACTMDLGPSDQTIKQTNPSDCAYVTLPANIGGTPNPNSTPTKDPCK